MKKLCAAMMALAGLVAIGGAQAPKPDDLDRLLAPIALYPDTLLAQMLLCAAKPATVGALNEWMAANPTLKGSDLQDAATKSGFDQSFAAMVLFPDVVAAMATELDWTTRLGEAFAADRSAVFASIQRLRKKASQAGKLKTTPQQEVETKTTSSGEQVIVIEPANPQVVYVPQYNPQTVYVPTTSTSTVVVQDDNTAEAVAAGLIGFTAGIALGAAIDNDYYYGPYGWRGGGYMYNDAWDDYYDAREDARDDWQDHREDMLDERGDRREDVSNERGDRASTAQQQRSDRQQNRPDTQGQREPRQTDAGAAASEARTTSGASMESRGYSSGDRPKATAERSGRSRTRSPATRAASPSARPARVARAAAAVPRAAAGGVDEPAHPQPCRDVVCLRGRGRGHAGVSRGVESLRSSNICLAGGRRQGDHRGRQRRKARRAPEDPGPRGTAAGRRVRSDDGAPAS